MNQQLSKGNIEIVSAWQLQLDNLRFENNKLRDSLANVISKELSHSFLEDAERFHQKLLDLDQITALMRHEIVGLLSPSGTTKITAITNLQLLQIKTDIDRCEAEFKQLETAFKQPPFKF